MRSLTLSCVSRFSLGKAEPVTLSSFEELGPFICKEPWSGSTFLGGSRTKQNFAEAQLIALDIDSGLSLEEAISRLQALDLKAIVAPTKSHQQEKNGEVTDRFRIVFALAEPITNNEDFYATWRHLQAKFPESDRACSDSSRFYYPSTEVVYEAFLGQPVPVTKGEQKEQKSIVALPMTEKGRLFPSTLQFLVFGARPGEWHAELFKACMDMKEQGYEEEEARSLLEDMCATAENAYEAQLDEHDLHVLTDVFTNRSNKHEFRPEPKEEPIAVKAIDLLDEAFEYLSDKERVKGDPSGLEGLDRLLGGGFRAGELTVLMAEAKTGKNTLYHYLMEKSLGQGVRQAYASRELDPAREVIPNLLSVHFQRNWWTADLTQEDKERARVLLSSWPLFFAPGYGFFPLEQLERWVSTLASEGVRHFWFDHLHYMLSGVEDHKEAASLIREIKTLAKRLDVHINLIVQPNKLMEGQRLGLQTIKGGSAIGQALDNLLILERVKSNEQKNISRLKLEVGRHKLCRLGELYLQYNPESTSFQEVEWMPETPSPTPEPRPFTFNRDREQGEYNYKKASWPRVN
jgi:replicative DNA helicase